MALLLNELSFHGQFGDLVSFRAAISEIMRIRDILRRFGRGLHCHKNLLNAKVMAEVMMPQAIGSLDLNQRRAVMQWITTDGPYWEDDRQHTPDDWLEHQGAIVTDNALGEAGWCCLHGNPSEMVSVAPSNWCFSPIFVEWFSSDEKRDGIDVANFWKATEIEEFCKASPAPVVSWAQLEGQLRASCINLLFVEDSFEPLRGVPFSNGSAQRIIFILEMLDRMAVCFDENGQRTAEGHELYQNFFTGKKEEGGRGALCSDSSDDEKSNFSKEMTFDQPGGGPVLCSWHGKVQTPQLRIHFSWPIAAGGQLFVPYIGPKITKK